MGKGVEYQKTSTDKFNAAQEGEKLMQAGGQIYACRLNLPIKNPAKPDQTLKPVNPKSKNGPAKRN